MIQNTLAEIQVVGPRICIETLSLSLGKLLSSKFGIQKQTKGKILNHFVEINFGNFSGNQIFISRKKMYFHVIGL